MRASRSTIYTQYCYFCKLYLKYCAHPEEFDFEYLCFSWKVSFLQKKKNCKQVFKKGFFYVVFFLKEGIEGYLKTVDTLNELVNEERFELSCNVQLLEIFKLLIMLYNL